MLPRELERQTDRNMEISVITIFAIAIMVVCAIALRGARRH